MNIYEEMLRRYTSHDRNAVYEVTQQIALAGLYRGGFFNHAAFYGGTCLRIFHGLQRFSEDMDFSLVAHDDSFTFEKFFPAIIAEFEAAGRKVDIKKKEKRAQSMVESAFLKDNTDVYDLSFQTQRSVRIKIEVDTNPPLAFKTEQKLSLLPFSFTTRCMTLPCLFAGKMHALVFRAWNNRVKGRDWYDFEWYVRHGVHLDFRHLQERIQQFNGEEMGLDDFKKKLNERLSTTDMRQVKSDVRDFLVNPSETDLWSNEYFLQLADMMQIDM